ncbi:MAG: metallophosphoesterase [Clostridiales bacterium]|nr:metallophosphoesterase [Clostridiales bacterium]
MDTKVVRKIKFLHCADIHLDCPFSSLPSTLAETRNQALKDVFSNIIDIAVREEVNCLFVCGDLFEHKYVTMSTINFINEGFKKLPNAKIFLVCGNHDPFINNSHYASYDWEENVVVFKKHISYAYIDEFDTYIYGSSFCDFEESESTVPNFDPLNNKGINILLTHGTFNMEFAETKYNPLYMPYLEELNMDYIGIGHFHNKFISGNVYNPGSPDPLGFDEEGEHGVFLVTIDKTSSLKVDAKFIPTNVSYYKNIELNLPFIDNDMFVIDKIKNSILPTLENPKATLMQLKLLGFVPRDVALDSGYIYNSLFYEFFYFNFVDATTPDYDWESLAKEPGLRGLFVSKLLEKIAATEDEAQKKILFSSLHYGISAIDNNDVDI